MNLPSFCSRPCVVPAGKYGLVPTGTEVIKEIRYVFECLTSTLLQFTSLVPPSEKQSGEQSRISWAHSPKVVRTNEIARLLITSVTTVKNFNLYSSICTFLSGLAAKCFERYSLDH